MLLQITLKETSQKDKWNEPHTVHSAEENCRPASWGGEGQFLPALHAAAELRAYKMQHLKIIQRVQNE